MDRPGRRSGMGSVRHRAGPLREAGPVECTTSRSGKLRVPSPLPLGQARSGERNRNNEAHPVDCVRIVHKTANVLNKLPRSVQPAAKAGPARDLDGAGPCDGRGGDRHLRREVRGQIRQGGRLPGQGPRGAAGLLRLPGRALGPPAHRQPDRERVRHRAAPHRPHQGRAVAGHRPADGVQAGDGRREDVAPAERREPVAQGHPGRHLPRRRRGRRHASSRPPPDHAVTQIPA